MAKPNLSFKVSLEEFGKKAAEYALDEITYNDLTIREWADKIASGEFQPVRHGRWIVHTTWHGMFGLIHSECSECKFDRNGDLSSWKFCPNCGVKMDGGADNG